MKINLTVQDIRNLKQKLGKTNADSDRHYLSQLTEMVELIFLKAADQEKEIENLKKDLKKTERKLTIEINRLHSRR